MFTFDASRLLECVSETRKEPYKALVVFWDDRVKKNFQFLQEKSNPEKEVDSCFKKLQGELKFK